MSYVDLQAKVKLAIERWKKWIQGWTDHWAWGPFSGLWPQAPQETQVHVESLKPQKDHMGNCEIQKEKSMKSAGFHSFTTTFPEQKKFGIYSGHKRVTRTADPH